LDHFNYNKKCQHCRIFVLTKTFSSQLTSTLHLKAGVPTLGDCSTIGGVGANGGVGGDHVDDGGGGVRNVKGNGGEGGVGKEGGVG